MGDLNQMKRLTLINPTNLEYDSKLRTKYRATRNIPPLACMVLGALTPKSEWHVKILDEQVERIDFEQDVDLVGITSLYMSSWRCYQIADQFRSRGITVIIGGMHASMLPEEAAAHADSVVIGEAEEIWRSILDDFCENKLKECYKAPRRVPMDMCCPTIKYDLVNPANYNVGIIQTSRGCPFKCEFCSVSSFLGTKRRDKPIDDVIKEIEVTPHRYILVADDNFFGSSRSEMNRAIAIMQKLVQRKIKKRFYVQTSINVSEHKNVLYWARRSGMTFVYLGIESLNPKVINGYMGKTPNKKYVEDKYQGAIKKLHKARMIVVGSVLYNNDEETFDSIIELIHELRTSKLDLIYLRPVLPMPGTEIFRRLQKDNRLLIGENPSDWESLRYVLTHKTQAIQNYEDSMQIRSHILESLYSSREVIKRTLKAILRTRSLQLGIICYGAALSEKKTHQVYIQRQEALAKKQAGSMTCVKGGSVEDCADRAYVKS